MSNGPLVSVVIATYNMANYLPLAIRSALEQTYRDIEILVVDDGSSDETHRVVQPLLVDPRVRYLYQANSGQATAKNHGIREARGRLVAFLDADDIWAREKLALQLPLFEKSEAVGVVFSRVAYIDANGNCSGVADNELFRGKVAGELLIRNFIGFGTSVIRKECLDDLGAFDEGMQMGIDYDLWLRLSTKYEFDFVDHPLLLYRIWPGQMSKNCKKRYASGVAIMQNFLQRFPHAVDKRTQRKAWAHTYVGYGQCVTEADRSVLPALRLYLRALLYEPLYPTAWKAIGATVLGLR